MRIALIGKNGQLGKSFYYSSFKNTFKTTFFGSKKLNFNNINNKSNLKFLENFDIIINCAAYTNVPAAEYFKKEAKTVNSTALKYLCSFLKKKNILLIHFSTDYVFNSHKKIKIGENHKKSPINFYGKTKLSGEKEIIKSGCDYIILRISWLSSLFGKNFFLNIIKKIHSGQDLYVVGDQYGSPTFCEDLIEVVTKIIFLIKTNKITKKNIYHFSSKNYCTWFDFARNIKYNYYFFNQKKKRIKLFKIDTNNLNSNVRRPRYSILNCGKIKNELKIKLPNWKISCKRDVKKFLKNV